MMCNKTQAMRSIGQWRRGNQQERGDRGGDRLKAVEENLKTLGVNERECHLKWEENEVGKSWHSAKTLVE